MCTRYSRVSLMEALRRRFEFETDEAELAPDYNIAPTDPAYVVIQEAETRRLRRMHFGLIPRWAKDPKIAVKCLNARAETVDRLPAFRDSFKSRRCLVLTDGFFEFARDGKKRIPYRVVMKNNEPYAMAGFWDEWRRPDGKAINTFAIVTTEPSSLIARIHNRMPCILSQPDEGLWLAPMVKEPKTLMPLLKPFSSDLMEMVPVSTVVNSSKVKSEECVRPARPPGDLFIGG